MDEFNQFEEISYKRKKKSTLTIVILLSIFLSILLYYFLIYRYYQSTDNAYVQANVTWIMPKISGEVIKLGIQDNQYVKEGEFLAILDNRDYQARFAQAQSLVELKEGMLEVQKQNELSTESNIQETLSSSLAAQADLDRLKKDYNRYKNLLNDGVITRQNFENINSQYITAQANSKKAHASVNAAKAQLSSLRASRTQILAEIKSAKANLDLNKIDLVSTKIISPISGNIGSLAIRVGSRVTPQTRLMGIIQENSLYIQANFKETQIKNIRIGQRVKLKLDAYPDLTYTGKIHSFSPASGATFSLMPPDNATGNFNKVVQRIPIRISIDSNPNINLVKPGMSVIATVDLRS